LYTGNNSCSLWVWTLVCHAKGLRLAAEFYERNLNVRHDCRNRVLISSVLSRNTIEKCSVHVTIKKWMKVKYPVLCYEGIWRNGLL